MKQPIFTDFEPRHAQLFGKHNVNLGHRLHQSELFSDASLARLIEKTPRHSYHVNTMDVTTHDPRTRREGMIEGLAGADALARAYSARRRRSAQGTTLPADRSAQS